MQSQELIKKTIAQMIADGTIQFVKNEQWSPLGESERDRRRLGYVSLLDRDCKEFWMQKQIIVRDGNQASRLRRLDDAVKQIIANNGVPNYRNLAKLGFGGHIIALYKKMNKDV